MTVGTRSRSSGKVVERCLACEAVAVWWGEAPERPISLRSAYGLYGLIVGNVGMRAEPLVPGCGNFETGLRNEKS